MRACERSRVSDSAATGHVDVLPEGLNSDDRPGGDYLTAPAQPTRNSGSMALPRGSSRRSRYDLTPEARERRPSLASSAGSPSTFADSTPVPSFSSPEVMQAWSDYVTQR